MSRFTVTIDESLMDEACRLVKRQSKREVIELALKDLVRRMRAREIANHAGAVALELTQDELKAWREDRPIRENSR